MAGRDSLDNTKKDEWRTTAAQASRGTVATEDRSFQRKVRTKADRKGEFNRLQDHENRLEAVRASPGDRKKKINSLTLSKVLQTSHAWQVGH